VFCYYYYLCLVCSGVFRDLLTNARSDVRLELKREAERHWSTEQELQADSTRFVGYGRQ